jgi:glycosidase
MIDIYESWIRDFGVDGFRIDTMKHVNDEFWQQFGPRCWPTPGRTASRQFFMFGEVFDTSKSFTSHFTTSDRMQSVLDFPFQDAARNYASKGQAASALNTFFAATTGTPTRIPTCTSCRRSWVTTIWAASAALLSADNPGAGDAAWVARDRLAHELMFLSRGNPVIYYGDEQGFTGPGGDQNARQSMFASRVPDYLDDDLLGTTATHAQDNFNPTTRCTARSALSTRSPVRTPPCAMVPSRAATPPAGRRLRLLPDRPGPAARICRGAEQQCAGGQRRGVPRISTSGSS